MIKTTQANKTTIEEINNGDSLLTVCNSHYSIVQTDESEFEIMDLKSSLLYKQCTLLDFKMAKTCYHYICILLLNNNIDGLTFKVHCTVENEWVWDSSYHGTSIPNLDIKFS